MGAGRGGEAWRAAPDRSTVSPGERDGRRGRGSGSGMVRAPRGDGGKVEWECGWIGCW